MIMYFPYPYPDELVFSLISRYHIHSANQNRAQTSRDLHQFLNTPIRSGFPNNLGRFMESMPKNWELKMDDLIQKHTVFPLYKAFLPHETSLYIDMRILGNAVTAASNVIPSIDFDLYPNFWRYCDRCVNEDIEIYGELYLRRIHQILGFPICLIHGEELLRSSTSVSDHNNYTVTLRECYFLGNTRFESLGSIAKDIAWIFQHMPQPKEINFPGIYQEYLLNSTNFVDYKGDIEFRILAKQIEEFYGETCISRIVYEIFNRTVKVEEWLQRLIYRPDINNHPILHLLLIHFLGLTYEEFLNQSCLESNHEVFETVLV
ncbi:TnsD family Tn7-like transposition protein [Bacillus mobilis]|uniref:TnsD family Tn7-like transposition protein n=1 Tax=Bacillus mobilis TaxID=2026190 RepID=UPI0021D155DE|nr:TnsD family Tn7-like transposition protein [Bacillus mobilis]MCU5198028.1 TnsD family transposase [Bacillus mobilis]